jgi:hypothetical protein
MEIRFSKKGRAIFDCSFERKLFCFPAAHFQ